jgi:hypothetical protein
VGGGARNLVAPNARPQFQQLEPYRLGDALKIVEDFLIAKPQHVISLHLRSRISLSAARQLLVGRMRRAVHFNDQPRLVTREVDDKLRQVDLTPKSKAVYLILVDDTLQTLFRRGRFSTQTLHNRL